MNNKKTQVINLAFVLCVALQSIACSPFQIGDISTLPTPIDNRIVGNSTLQLTEMWRTTNPIPLIASIFIADNSYLISVEYDKNGLKRWLNVRDAQTGGLIWKTDPLPFPENSVVIDYKNLYLALSRKILSYDLLTGELLWEITGLPERVYYKMYIKNEQLFVYSEEDIDAGNTKQVIRIYNSQTGELMNYDEKVIAGDAVILLLTSKSSYWTDRKNVWTVQNHATEPNWTFAIENPVQHQPLLVNNNFIFASGIFSKIIAINSITGDQIWNYDKKIVSNLSTDMKVVYAIRQDAVIVGINPSTGGEIGFTTIFPNYTEEQGTRAISFKVTATDNMIFVYYGDSQEIIAFSKR